MDSPVRITLPFKDQKSADIVRTDLRDLGKKIDRELSLFTIRKVSEFCCDYMRLHDYMTNFSPADSPRRHLVSLKTNHCACPSTLLYPDDLAF